jgi:GNAT superfamily N-acetyltransferase
MLLNRYESERRFAVEKIVIRKITRHEVERAMHLALEVFMQFEAPDYPPEGVETFKKDIVENPEYLENARRGVCPIYGAFDGDNIVALMGMRSNRTHINLVFTKKEYHRQGIASAIFRYLLDDVLKENPALEALTLNSSPYGLPFYRKIGFIPLSEEQTINGIRFTPMKYIITP